MMKKICALTIFVLLHANVLMQLPQPKLIFVADASDDPAHSKSYAGFTDIDNIGGNFTIQIWFKANTTFDVNASYIGLIGNRKSSMDASLGNGIMIGFSTVGGIFVQYLNQNFEPNSNITFFDNGWHTYTVKIDSSSLKLSVFIDENEIGTMSIVDGDTSTDSEYLWVWGDVIRETRFQGEATQLAIFNCSLTDNEITFYQIQASHKNVNSYNTVACYTIIQ